MSKELLQTTDYSMFKKLEGNRPVKNIRVRKIIASIKAVGYITSPIIVNEKYEVIDGQGRLEALQELGLPVEYIVHEGIGIEECIAMNINQTNWSLPDYIDSYCQREFDSYLLLRDLMDKYPLANLDTICTALFRIQSAPIVPIKDGTLVITQEQYEQAQEVLDYAYDLFQLLDKNTIKGSIYNLVQAVILCYNYPEVNNKRLKQQISTYAHLANAWIDTDTCLQEVERLYNRNLSRPAYIFTLYREERARLRSLAGKESIKDRKRDEFGRNFVASDEVKHKFLV